MFILFFLFNIYGIIYFSKFKIRPKPFEEICSNGGKQQHCTATSAYLQVCSNAGIITALPHECGKN